jgi:hypothetical protein
MSVVCLMEIIYTLIDLLTPVCQHTFPEVLSFLPIYLIILLMINFLLATNRSCVWCLYAFRGLFVAFYNCNKPLFDYYVSCF